MAEKLLIAKNIKAYYRKGSEYVKAVDNVSLDIYEGEIIGIVGESGCGKTTLTDVLQMNILKPLTLIDGSIEFKTKNGYVDISKLSRKEVKEKYWGSELARIPQASMNALMPTIKIKKYVEHLAKSHNINPKDLIEKAKERLKKVGLKVDVLDMYPFELSGGMRQRAVIAVGTLLDPHLLVADEPTSALDVVNQKLFLKALKQFKEEGIVKSVLFITHDIATIRQLADRMLIMYAGRIAEIGNTDDMVNEAFHPYSKGLFNSVLTPEPEIKKRGIITIPGAPPNLLEPPKGCRFHPRCPHVMDICKKEVPPVKEYENGRQVACFLYSEGSK
ncbi:ABC transporter ATP-binding protein [Marinitoga litoralis]|jgi:peptide/nickel transport system ATP-binding protein|uniref:ABC transporter ATP-binding protein n=1 Tax=Marinitoga litoralis TaxID=570855 RepID=UPI001960A9C0|nr:ABC transporter ATP-binding protein [Marinitoga litoralis]MBM7559825.1 peptide/nickel transport system ATP-binding protein [Marinitoga litoralis]